jgi:hypothetical protein
MYVMNIEHKLFMSVLEKKKRGRQDSNLRGQSPHDF